MILHFSQIGFTDDLTFTVILLSFVVRLVPPYRIHTSSNLSGKRHYGLPYLYINASKKGIIQAFQQSSLEHYNTFILENQAFSWFFFILSLQFGLTSPCPHTADKKRAAPVSWRFIALVRHGPISFRNQSICPVAAGIRSSTLHFCRFLCWDRKVILAVCHNRLHPPELLLMRIICRAK